MTVHSHYAAAIPSTEFRFNGTDGLSIARARWDSCSPVRGVIPIAHGMGEHIGRYIGVKKALVSAGLTTYVHKERELDDVGRATIPLGVRLT